MILSLLIVPPVIQRLKKISSFVFLIVIIFTDSNYFIIRTPGSQIKMNVYNKDRTYFYIFRQRGGSIFSSFFSAFFLLPPPSFFYGSFPFPNRRKKRKRQASHGKKTGEPKKRRRRQNPFFTARSGAAVFFRFSPDVERSLSLDFALFLCYTYFKTTAGRKNYDGSYGNFIRGNQKDD